MTSASENCPICAAPPGSLHRNWCNRIEGLVSPINPKHYTWGGLEVIEVLRAKLTREEFLGYLRGNVLKYVFRAGFKDSSKLVEDLQKAKWYLDRLEKEASDA